MSIDYKADFSAVPLGPLTDENKRKAWAPAEMVWSDEPEGKYKNVVDDPTKGRVCEHLYPGGVAGASKKQYQIRLGPCSEPVMLEFDVMFVEPFAMTKGPGKLPVMLCWGPFSGANSGVVQMVTWASPGSIPPESFTPALQNQPDGHQYISVQAGNLVRSDTIVRGRWYHWKYEMLGGPEGYARYWLDGKLLDEYRGQAGNTRLGDGVIINVSGFYGGGDGSAPPNDGFVRVANIHVYQQAGAGNGDGGTGEGGGDTGPTPPVGPALSPHSIALGETKIFRARFFDIGVYPAQEIPAGSAVKWSLEPNNVRWGPEAGPNWSAIEVQGKTVGGPCTLTATDPASGITTEPMKVDITQTPRPTAGASVGLCTVEPLPPTRSETSAGKFEDKPPQ